MTNLRPIRPIQKLHEYGDCMFALQTDEPCKGTRGPFGIFAHGPTPNLLRHWTMDRGVDAGCWGFDPLIIGCVV